MLDVMHVNNSQSQARAQPLLPVQHVVCYLNEVFLSIIVPVQQLLQERAGTGREGPHVGREIMCWKGKIHKVYTISDM